MSTRRVIADRFEISPEDLIGWGGMGDVCRGTDAQTGETVAVKVLKPDIVASDPDLVARFVREGETLRQLNHPNIVQMVAAVQEREEDRDRETARHYLVMEYVGGGSLRDLLETEDALPIKQVVEIALELADALSRAHHLGIIHRDLKPSNVLLAEDGTPRLSDFGLALVSDSPRMTQTGILVGSVAYLSPEACNGETLDNRADLWALGVMLYEMLTGELPFTGETLTAALAAILTQPIPDLASLCSDAPDALVDLVYRTLEKDRHQRIPSARLVGAELEAISKGWQAVTPTRLVPTESRFTTPTPPADAPRHNLPVQSTPFVGREAELDELARLLADPDVRLLTVLGAGGMGKTRLASQAAEAQLHNYAHGVFFVSLASLQSVDAIVPTVAEALGFSFYADARGGAGVEPRQQLLDYLSQKNTLILMDNYEHLLDGVGLINEILQIAPGVQVLATSRARLNVGGENRFQLAGMDFPDWETPEDALEYSAVKLFMQSARRARPGFELQADDLKYVARICRLVEGMPLGIRLAAAWVEMLSPQEIATEISHSLDFLETDRRDVPERQRSIRAVFDYSWNLLGEREQDVFQTLSVFRGGFTRETAQQVTGASLRDLMALVNRSLLHRKPTGRYEVHELSRQYAAEMLTRSPDARETAHDRHSAVYTAILQRWAADSKGPRQQAALAEMDVEIKNARAAWDWAVEQGQIERLNQAMEGLGQFYLWRNRYQEGEIACRTAAEKLATAASGDGLRTLAKILTWQGIFNGWSGNLELGFQLLEQSLATLERPELAEKDVQSEKAFALTYMGLAKMLFYDTEAGKQSTEQSLALYRSLGDHWGTANALAYLGAAAENAGALGKAKQWHEESLAIRQALGDRQGIADSLADLGLLSWVQGQLEKAKRLFQESLAIYQETGNRARIALALKNLGESLVRLGEFAEGHSLMEEGLAVFDDLGDRFALAWIDLFLSEAQTHLGQYERARALGQTGLASCRKIAHRWGIGFSHFALGLAALAIKAHDEAHESLRESVAVFQEIKHRENMGWALAALGYAARGLGQFSQARRYLSQALQTATDIEVFMPLIYGLPAAALLLADQGKTERAVELYALASRYPFVSNSRWFEDVAGKHIAVVAATLPSPAVEAAQERGRNRDLWATAAELLDELGE